jgi:homogentisate 1,2-dioxygenase
VSPNGGSPQWVRGEASRQAHVGLPAGTFEEEHGREGFSGPASHLYRRHPPTGWSRIEGPLRPHALDTRRLGAGDTPPTGVVLLENDDLALGWHHQHATPEWFTRDADGDRCYFVHRGEGRVATEYGPLAFRPGSFVVVPRATTHRVEGDGVDALLVVAREGSLRLPDRGLLGRHALFDPAMLDVPEPEPVDSGGEHEVRVVRRGAVTSVVYPHHPFDVVGWKGDLAPVALHVDDFRPVVSARYHLPPSAHTTFVADRFVIATFAPRPFETDPDALRVPFFHRNVDYDEVIFYHSGEFFSRVGIDAGMLTFHPAGIHHGPQPGALARAEQRGPGGHAEEVAINVDARRPLTLTPAGEAIADPAYVRSWQPVDPPADDPT